MEPMIIVLEIGTMFNFLSIIMFLLLIISYINYIRISNRQKRKLNELETLINQLKLKN